MITSPRNPSAIRREGPRLKGDRGGFGVSPAVGGSFRRGHRKASRSTSAHGGTCTCACTCKGSRQTVRVFFVCASTARFAKGATNHKGPRVACPVRPHTPAAT